MGHDPNIGVRPVLLDLGQNELNVNNQRTLRDGKTSRSSSSREEKPFIKLLMSKVTCPIKLYSISARIHLSSVESDQIRQMKLGQFV